MLNLIKNIWNQFTSGLATVYHWVLNTIAALYSYVNRLFDDISKYAVGVYDALQSFAHSVDVWVTRTVASIFAFIKSEATAIVRWAVKELAALRSYAIDVYEWALRSFDYLDHWISSQIDALTRWVIANIWNPLFNDVRSLFAWVGQYGAWLWDMVSNPQRLVAWLSRYLLSAWLNIMGRWAAPILSFFIRQAYRAIPDIVALLEEAINKAL